MTDRHEQATPGSAEQLAAMFGALVPVIWTKRLTLRAPRLADFPACAEVACSERGKHLGGPMSRADAWFEFSAMVANWCLHGHGGFAIEDADGTTLGFIVLGLEPGDHEVELGYSLIEAAEGKGIAEEAARAVRAWAANELGLTRLVSYIDAGNARSIALAERMGAVRDTAAEAAIGDANRVYRHPEEQA